MEIIGLPERAEITSLTAPGHHQVVIDLATDDEVFAFTEAFYRARAAQTEKGRAATYEKVRQVTHGETPADG